MNQELKTLLDQYIDTFLNQDLVKKYFVLQDQINNSPRLIAMQKELKNAQKQLALSLGKDNYSQMKENFLNLQKEFYQDPIINNYMLLEKEIYEQLKSLQDKLNVSKY